MCGGEAGAGPDYAGERLMKGIAGLGVAGGRGEAGPDRDRGGFVTKRVAGVGVAGCGGEGVWRRRLYRARLP